MLRWPPAASYRYRVLEHHRRDPELETDCEIPDRNEQDLDHFNAVA